MDRSLRQNPAAIVGGLAQAAILLNRCDLRSKVLTEAREFNAAEQAVRAGIALIETPQSLFEAIPLVWGRENLCGADILVGRGLGLKYCVAPNLVRPGWSWTLGDGAGPDEETEEGAMASCQADFTERLRASIRPLAASN